MDTGNWNPTPLHEAAKTGNVERVKVCTILTEFHSEVCGHSTCLTKAQTRKREITTDAPRFIGQHRMDMMKSQRSVQVLPGYLVMNGRQRRSSLTEEQALRREITTDRLHFIMQRSMERLRS